MLYTKALLLIVNGVVLSLIMGWIYERAACQLRIALLASSQPCFTLERVQILHYDHPPWPLWQQLCSTALLFFTELLLSPIICVLGFAEFGLRALLRTHNRTLDRPP